MMEWGIVRKNDPFLWGEKVKAYLRRGAQPLPGFEQYPNASTGGDDSAFQGVFLKYEKYKIFITIISGKLI